MNQFLSLRTYLVGYQLTIADLQIWGQLQGTVYCTHAAVPILRFVALFDASDSKTACVAVPGKGFVAMVRVVLSAALCK